MADGLRPDPGGDPDAALLVAARADPALFVEFYDRRYERVLGFFYRRILCPHTAAELTAEAFARALASLHRYDPARGQGIAWLMGIATNLYRNWLREGVVSDKARRRWRIATPELGADDLEHVETLVDLEPLLGGLSHALDRLSPAVRDAVLLRVGMDLPYQEVAARLGCSEGAARVRVSRGLDRLYLLLEEQP